MDLQLKDKVAVITGGSVGIGLAVAEELASEGVHLALIARGGERAAERAAEIQAKHGVKAIGIGADVSRAEDVTRALAEIDAAFGGADILISNAGTGSNETVMNAPDEKWQYFWDLHVMAAVRMSRGLIPLMRQRGGGVILMNASICAKQPLGYEPIYNVTKAALMMFSKCLSNEVVGDNIRVNCINPGLILTPDWVKTATQLTAGTDSNAEAYLDDIAKKNAPIGRFGSPEELAHFFVFMCSPLSSYCVGSTYYVDGGWLNVVA
jgi:NAD(P)-dependent dehydrogenase (short-subunit alcohol dehydrogenase family)